MSATTTLQSRGFVFVPPTSDVLTHRASTLVVAVAATVSSICSFVLLAWMAFLVFCIYRRQMREWTSKFAFLHTQFGVLFANLLVAYFIQSLAFSLNYYWFFSNKRAQPSASGLCSVQGIGIQAGDVASAIWSFLLALHTIAYIVWRHRPSNTVVTATVPLVWIVIVILTSAGPIHVYYRKTAGGSPAPFYNAAGLWCSIGHDYEHWRAYIQWLIVFISAFGSLLMYSAIFLWLWFRLFHRGSYDQHLFKLRQAASGRLMIDSTLPLSHTSSASDRNCASASSSSSGPSSSEEKAMPEEVFLDTSPAQQGHQLKECLGDTSGADERNRRIDRAALMMLLFPASYILSVLPLAAFRLGRSTQQPWSYNMDIQAGCGFLMAFGGTFNAILFILTRKVKKPRQDSESGSADKPSQCPTARVSLAPGAAEKFGPDGKPVIVFPAGVNVADFKFHTELFVAQDSAARGGVDGAMQEKERRSAAWLRRTSIGSAPSRARAEGRPMCVRESSGLGQTSASWDDGLSFHDDCSDGEEHDQHNEEEERERTGLQDEDGNGDAEAGVGAEAQESGMLLMDNQSKQEKPEHPVQNRLPQQEVMGQGDQGSPFREEDAVLSVQ